MGLGFLGVIFIIIIGNYWEPSIIGRTGKSKQVHLPIRSKLYSYKHTAVQQQ